MSTAVEFHFDPMCPFAYQTSLWIRDVREQLGIAIDWRFFSLEEVNRSEGQKHPWEREWSYGWSSDADRGAAAPDGHVACWTGGTPPSDMNCTRWAANRTTPRLRDAC